MIFPMKLSKFSGTSKFFAGVVVGAIVFSGSAIALNNYVSDNTPENGYLLCANVKTKAVTFPNKLSCPTGTKALDMGAVTGVEGPEGPMGPQGYTGPQGPAGASSASAITKLYSVKIPPRDIVFDGNANSLLTGKRIVLASLDGSTMPYGIYTLRADLSGVWSSTASGKNPLVSCYFQDKVDYDGAKAGTTWGGRRYGEDRSEYGNWTGIKLTVDGDGILGPTSTPIYLVCVTTGSISGLDGSLWAQRLDQYGTLTLGNSPLN
jgi:hypothetical protein